MYKFKLSEAEKQILPKIALDGRWVAFSEDVIDKLFPAPRYISSENELLQVVYDAMQDRRPTPTILQSDLINEFLRRYPIQMTRDQMRSLVMFRFVNEKQ